MGVGQNAVVASSAGNPTTGSGTSYACPNMAGMVACLWEAFPEFTNMQIIDVVQKSADRYATPDFRFGHGIPDFKKAVAMLTQRFATATTSFNNCVITVSWKSKDDTSSVYTLQRKLPGDINYTTIEEITSASIAYKANSYTYADTIRTAGNGSVQYRIVQHSRSADTTVEIANLQQPLNSVCFPENTLLASPSPFDHQLWIAVNLPEAIGNMGIQITDMMGRIMYSKKVDKPAGFYSTQVNTVGWSTGVYEVTLYNNGKRMYDRKAMKK